MKSLAKGLNSKVLGIRRVVYHPEHHKINRITIPVEQFGICPAVTMQGTMDDLQVMLRFFRETAFYFHVSLPLPFFLDVRKRKALANGAKISKKSEKNHNRGSLNVADALLRMTDLIASLAAAMTATTGHETSMTRRVISNP